MSDCYVIFENEIIRLQIPKQLRLKRDTAYYFSGVLIRGRKDARVSLAIVLDPPSVVLKGMRKTILWAKSHEVWLGVESRVIRKGQCSFGDGGIEVLGSSIVPEPTGTITLYRWVVLYELGGHWVEVDLGGGGDLEEFEKMGTTIIQSIDVLVKEPLTDKFW